MQDAPTGSSPRGLAEAIEANGLAFWELFCSRPGMEFHREPGLVWFASGYAAPTLNGVLWADLPGDELEAAIDEATARFRRRQLPMEWRVGPTTRPPNLGQHLARRGFALAEDIPALFLDLDIAPAEAPAPPGFRVEPVENNLRLEEWFRAWARGFDVPPFFTAAFRDAYTHVGFGDDRPLRNLVGFLDGVPVATATVFLAAGLASLHSITTVPEARRRGLGAAITQAALHVARGRGVRTAVLHSTPMGLDLYRRLGFQTCGRQAIFLAPA
ncbi:MAG: hypothetical protein A2Y93_00575 [Chloroflexi bacterium RBG_13_68_17]|nr:MAG: hypothetical protein A2Y93_00575 [Chloroflexi bacterium RBG_13_68_17]